MRTLVFPLLLLSIGLPSCVAKSRYDDAVQSANDLRAQLAKRVADDTKAMKDLQDRINLLTQESADRDARISQLSTDKSNLQAQLDDATALNEQLRNEIKRLGGDVDKMLADKSALSHSLEEARARLEELRKAQEAAEARAAVFQSFITKLKSMVQAGTLTITTRRGRLVLQLANDVLFESGQAEVKQAGKVALQQIATALKSITDRQFQVSGHTDNVPINTAQYPSNWELSAKRAINVVKFLVEQGVTAQELSAAGYGEFDPIAANTDNAGRAKNRRIEITLQPNIDELISMPNVDNATPPPPAAPAH
jgi:chemotaxis protein MotB